jgi:hypothetical protein
MNKINKGKTPDKGTREEKKKGTKVQTKDHHYYFGRRGTSELRVS